jgi:NDP-sugar pyrophosphorylase family protein
MEAIVLAGGKGERLGAAAGGLPKALVDVAGHALCEYQVSQLVAVGVDRVIVSCASGTGELFEQRLAGLDAEVVTVEEPEPLGRGGGLRYAAAHRRETGPIYAMNGDELLDVDFRGLLGHHGKSHAAATLTVTMIRSPFGIVEVDEDDTVRGFREGPKLPHWVSVGVYVLDDEALERLPERGDHETSTFPELAGEGKLRAYRHDGFWLTVNTPKELRRAEEWFAERPELHPRRTSS